MNRLPVALFSSPAKAEPIKQRLRSSGFTAELHGARWLQACWFVPQKKSAMHLEVPVDQFERAEKLLHEWDAAEHSLREAIRCLECGSFRVDYPQFARHSILTNLALGMTAWFGLVEKHYYCEDCHFTWPREGTRASRRRPIRRPTISSKGSNKPALSDRVAVGGLSLRQ